MHGQPLEDDIMQPALKSRTEKAPKPETGSLEMRWRKVLLVAVIALLLVLLFIGVKFTSRHARTFVSGVFYNPAVDLTKIRKTSFNKVGRAEVAGDTSNIILLV